MPACLADHPPRRLRHPTHQGGEQQRPDLPAKRRFRPGRVYSRQAREGPRLCPVEQLQGSTQAARFRPRLVYSRHRAKGPSTSSSQRGCTTIRLRPQLSATESEVHEAENNGDTATLPTTTFVAEISQPLPQPVLQAPPRRASPPQRRKKAMAPARRSVRIAARNWPRVTLKRRPAKSS